jgi:hypothetical protein
MLMARFSGFLCPHGEQPAPTLIPRGEEEEGAAVGTAPVLDHAFFRVPLDASGHGDEAGDAAIAGGADDGIVKVEHTCRG